MKFNEFLNEVASKAAVDEIESIDLSVKDNEFELTVYFNNQEIKEFEAEYYAGMFDFPQNADQTFLKPELPRDRAGYKVIVDGENAYDLYDDAKALSKKYNIRIEEDEDDR